MGHLIPTCYGSEQQISVLAIVHITYYCVLTNPHPPLPPRGRRSQPFPAFFQTTLIAAISCTAYKRIFASAVCWWFRSCHCLRAGVERKSGGRIERHKTETWIIEHDGIARENIEKREREKRERFRVGFSKIWSTEIFLQFFIFSWKLSFIFHLHLRSRPDWVLLPLCYPISLSVLFGDLLLLSASLQLILF